MGALAALYLQRAGHEVRFIHPRHRHIERSIHLPCGRTESLRWPVEPPDRLGDIRFLLLATKAQHSHAALAPLLPKLGAGCTLVRLQNGMGSLQALPLPWHLRMVEAISFSGSWRQSNEQHLVAENVTLMGDGSATPPDWFPSLTGHWPHLRWEADIELHQLMKLAVNAVINPLTALHDCNNGALVEQPALTKQARALAREVDSILRSLRPDWPGHTGERSLGVARDTATNTSSMRSDFRAGRKTEIDFINGWLLARAREAGLEAPLNARLCEQIGKGSA